MNEKPGRQRLPDLAQPLHRGRRISLSGDVSLVVSMVTVGFAPAAQAAAATTGNGRAAATEASPLGLFAALLDLLAGGVDADARDSTEAPAVTFAVPKPEGVAETTPALVETALAALVSEVAPAAIKTDGAVDPLVLTGDEAIDETADPAASVPALLQSFVEGLSALQDAVENEMPIDPTLEAKLIETLDALAIALGLPLPKPPAVDPAITAAATVDPLATAAIDPLAAVPTGDVPAPTGDPAEAPLPSTPPPLTGSAPMPALGAIAWTPIEMPAAPPPPVADTPDSIVDKFSADTAPEAELPPPVAELADRILKLAEAIEPRVPGLAKRLEAMAARLQTGDLDPALIAEFEIDADADVPQGEIVRAIARLLAPGMELKPLPEPARFAAPTLALPIAAASADDKAAEPRAELISAPTAPSPELSDTSEPADQTVRSAEAQPKTDAKPAANAPAPAPRLAGTLTPDTGTSQQQVTSAVAPTVAAPVAVETKAALAAYKPPPAQINIPQVAFEIVRQVRAGNSRFEIRLDPPELGRVEVKLDVDKAGNVSARMTVDRAETLDLMQRDRQLLERALAQAGLEGSKTSLEFSLRQNPFAREGLDFGGSRNGGDRNATFGTGSDAEPAVTETATDIYRGLASAGGVNLFV